MRANKQMLTLIPEAERSIDYRFEFAIVGQGAKGFAEAAVNSEMAEAFRPTAAKEKEKMDHIGEGDEEEDPEEAAKPADGADSAGAGEGMGIPKRNDKRADSGSDKNKLVLFCPFSEESKGLARVRFTCIEQFSDSLPLGRDAQAAMSQCVVFLFYPNGVDEADRKECLDNPIDAFKSDFISRFAEINHTPEQFRPYVRILCIEASPEDEETLTELGKTKGVGCFAQPDSGEDTVMESMTEIATDLVLRITGKSTSVKELVPETKPAGHPGSAQASSCCVVL